MRLAAALQGVRQRAGDRQGGLVGLPTRALAGLASLLVLAGLASLPGPVGAAHVLLIAGAALALLAMHIGVSAFDAPGDQHAVPRGDRFTDLCTTLERRLEQLQDVHWEISETDLRYRDLLDEQSDVILRRNAQGHLTFVNRAFVRVFGIAADEALGSTFTPVRIAAAEPPAIEPGRPERGTRTLEKIETSQGPRWYLWEEHAVTTGEAGETEIQVIGRDVTVERQRAGELAEARDQAEAANRAKSRFLAAMSHEIRTPMNGILGMASLLRETHPSEEQETYIAAIDQSARVLVALIDEILDFSKIEAGKIVLAEAPFSPAATAQSVVELLSPRAHDKGLELALTVEAVADRQLMGDEARVRQILLNLLSNAIKFTDSGGVSVSISGAVEDDGRVLIEMAVEDTGIGLSADDMQRLFLEFEQADVVGRRERGGTGLGLAISKRLARAMGGDIRVSSTPGRGSTFTARIVLKVAAVESGSVRADATGPAEALRVMLAMDREVERRSIAHMLRSAGQTVIEAETERAIGEVGLAAATGEPIDRVIVDVGCDAELAGQILAAARDAAGGRGVIGLVTVNVLARAGLAAFRAQGFERYLVRPVRVGSLLQQIAGRPAQAAARAGATGPYAAAGDAVAGEVAAVRSVASTPASADGAAPGRDSCRASVLLVEDNAINALMARRMLERCRCTVEHRPDGASGVACALEVLQGRRAPFDLILMDINMPGLDGIAAAKAIREAYAGAGSEVAGEVVRVCPPIISLTANAFPEDRQRCLDEGLDGYLAKPFDLSDLKAVLDTWTGPGDDEQRRRARGGAA